MGQGHQHGLQQQPSSRTSAWPQVVAWNADICVALGGNLQSSLTPTLAVVSLVFPLSTVHEHSHLSIAYSFIVNECVTQYIFLPKQLYM